MAEQTINYGEAMFKDIKPKEVLAGVKDAAVSWWNEFSPGTVAKGDVEAFDRVVGRIKNESLRTTLQEKKGLFSAFAKTRGVGTLVLDGTLATVPFYIKLKEREFGFDTFRKKQARELKQNAVNMAAGKIAQRQDGQEYIIDVIKDQNISWFDRLFYDTKVQKIEEKARAKALKDIERFAGQKRNEPFRKQLVKEALGKRLRGYNTETIGVLTSVVGVEAGVFAFRPATRLAKLQTKAGEAVGSWVVDHIVNNIVKGPNPDIAPSIPKSVS